VNVRTWICKHWLALDVLIAIGLAVLDTVNTLGGASWWPAHPGTLAWVMLAAQALADLSLAARRRAPLVVIGILAAFTVAISLLIEPAGLITAANSGNIWAPYGSVLAAYGPFYYCKDKRAAYAAVGTLTLLVARVWEPSVEIIALGVLRTAVGPLLALYYTARHAMVQALRDRAERAERESRLLAEQARADERARLAGEMHDVVTHRVSLMVLQAGALGVTATDEVTRQAAEELRTAGCQALDELRDLVGLLHAPPSSEQTASTPGIAALVAESAAVGTQARLDEHGDPAFASPVVGRTVYQIVREALTNVRKHAPGASVHVQISYGSSQVTVAVSNTPPSGHPGPGLTAAGSGLAATASDLAATGSGLGIASLRRRIELVHGTLRAGPTPDDGYRLEATLPAYVPTAEPAA